MMTGGQPYFRKHLGSMGSAPGDVCWFSLPTWGLLLNVLIEDDIHVTLEDLLVTICPVVGWCSIRTFTKPMQAFTKKLRKMWWMLNKKLRKMWYKNIYQVHSGIVMWIVTMDYTSDDSHDDSPLEMSKHQTTMAQPGSKASGGSFVGGTPLVIKRDWPGNPINTWRSYWENQISMVDVRLRCLTAGGFLLPVLCLYWLKETWNIFPTFSMWISWEYRII